MNKNRKSLIKKLIIGAVIVLLLVAALWFGLRFFEDRFKADEDQFGDHGDWGNGSQEKEEKVLLLDDTDYTYTDDVRTYLLIGTDNTGTANPAEGRGEMADFLMLFVVNQTNNSYGFIQLNRDTMMDVPGLDKYTGEEAGTAFEQICIAHWYGTTPEERNANTVEAVSRLFGDMEINGYYTINMKDIGALNDAVGGVLVTIDEDLTSIDPELKEGTEVLLNAKQAEAYVRARMNVGKGTNEERMARQLNYMKSAYSRVINQLREEPNYINSLYDEMKDRIQTDRNGEGLNEFAKYISSGENKGFIQLDGEAKIGDTLGDGVEHAEFYLNEGSVARALKKLINLKEETNEATVED